SSTSSDLIAAQQRIAALEREVADLTHKNQLEIAKAKRESSIDAAALEERQLLKHKISQLEAAVVMHKRVMESQQKEVEQAKAAAAKASATLSSSAPLPAGPSQREVALEEEVR